MIFSNIVFLSEDGNVHYINIIVLVTDILYLALINLCALVRFRFKL